MENEENTEVEEIEFMLEYTKEGECVNGESFNPTQGWTNYTEWDQGWSEQDEKLNDLLVKIREYSQSMELEQLVAEMEVTDINKVYKTEFEGNSFEVMCTNIVQVDIDG